MKTIITKTTAILLFAVLLSLSCIMPSAVSEDDLMRHYNATAEKLLSDPVPQVGSMGGEWEIIGLARSGRLSAEAAEAYYQNVAGFVADKNSAVLNKRKSTDNSRVILALSAINRDARDVSGFDLLSPLSDFDYVKRQGINGVIWALIALDSKNYPVASGSDPSIRERLVEHILSAQLPDGGWTGSGDISDPDITAMALQALAPYCRYDNSVQAAVDKAVELLSSLVLSDNAHLFTPETDAQIITALASLGIDPTRDERFCKNGSDLTDYIMQYAVDGGFEHEKNGGFNQMSTEQAFYSLTAYYRLLNGNTTLYDMTDTGMISGFMYDFNRDGIEDINDVTTLQAVLAEYEELPAFEKRIADKNKNGVIDITDAAALQYRLAFEKD